MPDTRSSAALAGQLGTLYNVGTVGSLPDDQLVEIFPTLTERRSRAFAHTGT